ncbi:MAG: sigma-70 family RNA polymerase sigma factor [Verrucomicrobia bacterium]|nr:sigma-70 family RNA polymerase sigma factor [Cytophagales bacterium]
MLFFKRSDKKQTPKSDAELLVLYRQSGDLLWLGELYERYTTLVYGICLKYLKDREQSKDMVMQVFEKLITELRFREVENFKSWLHVLTKNECLMQLRRDKKIVLNGSESTFSADFMENGQVSHHQSEDEAHLELNLQVMEEGLQHLSEEQKVCLTLFFLEEKSYKEITEITGFDMNKVKSYIQNGKRNLKIFVEKNGLLSLLIIMGIWKF